MGMQLSDYATSSEDESLKDPEEEKLARLNSATMALRSFSQLKDAFITDPNIDFAEALTFEKELKKLLAQKEIKHPDLFDSSMLLLSNVFMLIRANVAHTNEQIVEMLDSLAA